MDRPTDILRDAETRAVNNGNPHDDDGPSPDGSLKANANFTVEPNTSRQAVDVKPILPPSPTRLLSGSVVIPSGEIYPIMQSDDARRELFICATPAYSADRCDGGAPVTASLTAGQGLTLGTVTMPCPAGMRLAIIGFSITWRDSTTVASTNETFTINNTEGGNLVYLVSYQVNVPGALTYNFPAPIFATGADVAITCTNAPSVTAQTPARNVQLYGVAYPMRGPGIRLGDSRSAAASNANPIPLRETWRSTEHTGELYAQNDAGVPVNVAWTAVRGGDAR